MQFYVGIVVYLAPFIHNSVTKDSHKVQSNRNIHKAITSNLKIWSKIYINSNVSISGLGALANTASVLIFIQTNPKYNGNGNYLGRRDVKQKIIKR